MFCVCVCVCVCTTHTAGSDYSSVTNQVLTFTSVSSQQQCINIGIIDDVIPEPIEQFSVQLTQSATQDIAQAVVSITDDDGK